MSDDPRFQRLQRFQMKNSTPAETGLAAGSGQQTTDAQALQNLIHPQSPNFNPVVVPGMGMNQQEGQQFDQAKANLAAKYGNTASVPSDYEQKAAALQQVIDTSNSQGSIQQAQNQLQQLKANKPPTLDVDDLEEIPTN
jgi:hypothetical protein